jgi:hypothetical protein
MCFRSAFHPFIQTWCLEAHTLVRSSCGILGQSTYRSSKRHYPLPAIHILFMRCKWLVHKMRTTLSRAVRTEWSAVGWSTCWHNLKCVFQILSPLENSSFLSRKPWNLYMLDIIRPMKCRSPHWISRTTRRLHFSWVRKREMYTRQIDTTELARRPVCIRPMCIEDMLDLSWGSTSTRL